MIHSYAIGGSLWRDVVSKPRRPADSIILRNGMFDSLLSDAREFVASEPWYNKAGIPHRMGFLLYGPPGTGKSEYTTDLWPHESVLHSTGSTIYALAGELGFEIYSLSLASQR